jgi:lipid A ethanolaminephosphotransferase
MNAGKGMRPLWPVAGASLWMATASNFALWREMSANHVLERAPGWALAAALALIITAALTALISLLAWRWTLKPVLILLLVASAAGAYFMLAYHVVIDRGMIVNVLQTDFDEASALVNWRMLGTLGVLGVLPAVIVWRLAINHAAWPAQALRNLAGVAVSVALIATLVLLSFQPLSSTMRNHKQLRYLINPLNTIYALGHAASQPLRRQAGAAPLGTDAMVAGSPARPPLLVLVLGETGRSGNFALNGYDRPTTPELARENVVSARRVTSCGTSTAASVPCMFSHLGRDGFEARTQDNETLLDVLQHAGLAVLWLDNQSGCKGVCDRVPHVDTSSLAHPQLCPGGHCLDGIMLEGLDERLRALPAERRARGVVLVMHQMGSHGPAYHLRSPAAFKRFLPECVSESLQDCSRAELVNAYDNSIVYTDHFLASTIGWLKQQQADFDTAMLYVADHGESLGENNLYLHGMPYSIAPDVQKHVPWITWLSPGFETRIGVGAECLRANRDAPLSHDNYFHSVLGLMQVSTSVYNRQLDAYSACAVH